MNAIGNPYVVTRELYGHQGYHPTTDVDVIGESFSIMNADKVRFDVEALNMDFDISLRKVNTNGYPVYNTDGTPVADIPLFTAVEAPLAGGKKAFEFLFDATDEFDSLHSHYRLVIRYKALSAYVPPSPLPTGVTGLHNSAWTIKDELAPLLRIKAVLINPKY